MNGNPAGTSRRCDDTVSRVDLLQVADLTPNIGLQWYFFQEMFAHFRPFWHFVYHAAAAAMVRQPLCCDAVLAAAVWKQSITPFWRCHIHSVSGRLKHCQCTILLTRNSLPTHPSGHPAACIMGPEPCTPKSVSLPCALTSGGAGGAADAAPPPGGGHPAVHRQRRAEAVPVHR